MVKKSIIPQAKTIAAIRKWRLNAKGSVGFIPTMGYLHAGHLSLVKQAKKENDHVVVSIFVNPKQFGPKEDFATYPRDEKRDLELLASVKTDAVFLPDVDEIYPEGFETTVSVTRLSKILEGERRTGHFDGVATIIAKLFNIIQPQKAYFGQKDAQQVAVIKKLVKDLQIPVSIVTGETVRESDGLAMSSRNVYLQKKDRKEAAILSEVLLIAQVLFSKKERNTFMIKNEMKKRIEKTNGKIDYISIADTETFDELVTIKKEALVSLAVYFGETRLIDNITLK